MANATQQWWYELPTGEQLEIWAYTNRVSYTAGEPVCFTCTQPHATSRL
jgi:hypothetical protein